MKINIKIKKYTIKIVRLCGTPPPSFNEYAINQQFKQF
jgi:hypothetical protein